MLKKNIFNLLICLVAIPALVLLMQNCAKSESTAATIAADCTYELACTDPSGTNGNEICISGRVVDGVDRTANLTSSQLSNIEVRLYEPVAFFSNTATLPFKTLTSAAGDIDSCGRFTTRINVATDTAFGSVGLVTTDLTGSGFADYILSATVRQVSAYRNLVGARTYLVSSTQDQAWSTAAGLGTTFATAGTIAVRYYQGGNDTDPVPGYGVQGITPTWNGSPNSAIDNFFSDSTRKTMQTIDSAQNVTGANGVAFLQPGSGFGTVGGGAACLKYDGTPGTLAIVGPTSLAAAAGVISFQDLEVTCN